MNGLTPISVTTQNKIRKTKWFEIWKSSIFRRRTVFFFCTLGYLDEDMYQMAYASNGQEVLSKTFLEWNWNSKADQNNCIRYFQIRVHLVCEQNMILKCTPNVTWYHSASILRTEKQEKNLPVRFALIMNGQNETLRIWIKCHRFIGLLQITYSPQDCFID